MNSLDPHVVVQILSYLHPNKLAQFRLVCRQWQSLIALDLKNSVKEIEIHVDSFFQFRFVKPWRTRPASIENLFEQFQCSILSVFDPISVKLLKIKTENRQLIEHIPFYIFKNLCLIGTHCPNVEHLDLSDYAFMYVEELARINQCYPNLTTLDVHEIGDTFLFDGLKKLSVGSCNGTFAEFLYNNEIVTLTMPISWSQIDDELLQHSGISLNRLTSLHLTSVGDLKTLFARLFFQHFVNLETLKIENTKEHTYNAQAMNVLSDHLRYLPKLKNLCIEDYRVNRASYIGNGTQQPLYDLLRACTNLTSLCLKIEVSKPTVVCHAITIAADQSNLENLELEFRGTTNHFVEFTPLFQCAKNNQFVNLKRLTLYNVARSNILLLISKNCPHLECLRLNKDDMSEEDYVNFIVVRTRVERPDWRVFRLEIQKSSRWYATFVRKLLQTTKVKYEMYTTTSWNSTSLVKPLLPSSSSNGNNNASASPGLVPAFKVWNNDTRNLIKIFDLVKFSTYIDTFNYLFGSFHY